jgi:hypothetical protein
MIKLLSSLLLAAALLAAAPARAQAPAAEVQALTKRLNELMRSPDQKDHTDVFVSLADCGVRQTVRKYRSAGNDGNLNISVSNSKNGSNWGVKSNDKVELELNLGLDWAEIGAVSYQPKTDEESGRRYFELKLLRRPAAAGGKSSGLDSISLPLYTQDEKAVSEVVRRLGAVRRQCSGQKG